VQPEPAGAANILPTQRSRGNIFVTDGFVYRLLSDFDTPLQRNGRAVKIAVKK